MKPLIELSGATVATPSGRLLFDGLSLCLSTERVALIGRNGVGKSTLLAVLAGETEPRAGDLKVHGRAHLVPQILDPTSARCATSHGERRKLALAEARCSGAEILLLDEPTEDLDDAGVSWLRSWLVHWPGALVAATHDRRLLEDFRQFFVVEESGCRCFSGTLLELDAELEREHRRAEQRYARNLQRLAAHEEHTLQVAHRKARKKRRGRCSELDRATPRVRLNQKRDYAQVGHGRAAKVREARLASIREWSKSTRRALDVSLSLELPVPALPEPRTELLVLRGVSARAESRCLFESLELRLGRSRVGVVGPNGAGKTTLLEIALGRRAPATGTAQRDLAKIGAIAQGGADWMLDESLLSLLDCDSPAELLVAHRFPLALAARPLRSLSPGERVRAALICLFRRSPPIELLVLDEPTFSLDLVGRRAMTEALRAWPGGLLIASHDLAFLFEIGVGDWVRLGS